MSRVTGFLRDVVLGAVLGAGALADAFFVAFRLPNHFRAIFGEGAFNSAYVPSYSRVLETRRRGARPSSFASQIFTILLLSQIVLPGPRAGSSRPTSCGCWRPASTPTRPSSPTPSLMTRITFPYLLCVTLVTLQSGTLNAHRLFAAAAFAPVLLNVVMIGFPGSSPSCFPNAGSRGQRRRHGVGRARSSP